MLPYNNIISNYSREMERSCSFISLKKTGEERLLSLLFLLLLFSPLFHVACASALNSNDLALKVRGDLEI